jgi:hypothetical protein
MAPLALHFDIGYFEILDMAMQRRKIMDTHPGGSYKWWCLVIKIGVFIFFAMTVYGAISRWISTPYYFSLTQRLLGLLVDTIGLALLFMSQLHLVKLSRSIRLEAIFSLEALREARNAFIYFLSWTAYVPLQRGLETLVATMHNSVGNRFFVFSFGMPDLIRILILAILAFLIFVLQRGIDLTEDQSLTI